MSTLSRSETNLLQQPVNVKHVESLRSATEPRLLAVSYSYPPQTEPRAIQVSRLLKHLKASIVLVCEGSPSRADDIRSIEMEDAESFLDKMFRIPLPTSSWRRVLNALAARVYLPVWARTPDHLGAWKRPVVETVEDLLRTQDYRPDVLVTFAFPLVDNLIGLKLKRRFKLPWVAHFSDPWVDSPFREVDPLTKALNTRLEQSVIEGADRVVFTSPETAELVLRKYRPALQSKVRIVPHAYEPDLFCRPDKTGQERMIVRYLGDFYLGRTPKPLFQALELLSSTEPELLNNICFEVVGAVQGLDLEQMGISRLPKGLVVFRPRVSYRESLSLMTSAAGLMVIDAPVPANSKSVFLPSKLIEYVGAARPVIGLTPPGTAADLIERLGGWVADPKDVNEVARVMREYLLFLRERRADPFAEWGRREVREEFEAETVATEFQRVLMELV